MKKPAQLFLSGLAMLFFLAGCSDDDSSSTQPVTTEPVIEQTFIIPGTGSAANPDEVFFSFESGAVVPDANATGKDWDVSFKRTEIRINGGTSSTGGNAGVQYIENQDYDIIFTAPTAGYITDGQGEEDNTGAGGANGLAFNNWYYYDAATHLVTPASRVYVVKTAKGRYAKLQILNYYNPDNTGTGGYYTFKYTYQPGGSTSFE